MAAKGSILKQDITEKILNLFPGAFLYNKEIRIPGVEDGSDLQIKCTLTCAKTNVENGGDTALPGSSKVVPKVESSGFPPVQGVKTPLEPTEEEKKNIETLLGALGF